MTPDSTPESAPLLKHVYEGNYGQFVNWVESKVWWEKRGWEPAVEHHREGLYDQ